MPMAHNHAPILALVDPADATHVAVNSGSWFDPNTWADGVVPGDDARVIVSSGVTVDYDGVSDARLFTVRVDGDLTFATDTDTRMVVDTMVVDHMGKLTIGTEDNPVEPGVSADIVFANNGDIDTNWDPTLVSRGLIGLGEVEIHGQETSTHHKVETDPMAGDTSLTLDEVPTNWEVGDTIVIAGSEYEGYRWDNSIRATRHYASEDEVRTITAINGDTVTFDPPLDHDHDTPRADLKVSVANYSRSVTFSTENADTAAVHERGHVMFHSSETDVRYAAFDQLGRTDKSIPAMDASAFGTIESDSNVKGRYSLHFHRTGVDDPDDPVMAVGNAVFGSPGWGIVHHDSNATVHNNATFDTFGAGFVAETGNEIGIWSENIAIYAKGAGWGNPKNFVDLDTFDTGRTGDGFWFQGRLVRATDNIAASVDNGFVYFHRGASSDDGSVPGNINIPASNFDLPEALGGLDSRGVDDAPVMSFSGNETFASRSGLFVVKANPNQGHDVHSTFQDFTAWNVQNGAHFEYTSHYIIRDFDLVARETQPFVNSTDGVSLGTNTTDMTLINIRADGFERSAINLLKNFTNAGLSPDLHGFVVVDGAFTNNGTDFLNYDPAYDTIVDSSTLTNTPFSVDLGGRLTYREGYPDPGARHVSISGTRTDSLGTTPVPSGTDNFDAGRAEVIRILETDGWFETTTGEKVFFLEDYYSDRLTGEVHKVVMPVYIDDNVPLGNQYFSYANARYAGVVDLASAPPAAEDEAAITVAGQDLVIDLALNDSDPEGAQVQLDGIMQPLHGQIFVNPDGTVTYRPFLDFTGTETVKYWVTDGAGKYSEAFLTIDVRAEGSDLKGSGASDWIGGDAGDNVIRGHAGDDVLSGGAGDDDIGGWMGRDVLYGGAGNDVMRGGAGRDVMRGEAGDDVMGGGAGADVMYGGRGNDLMTGRRGNDRLYGQDGDDVVIGGSGNDRVNGGNGDDTLLGRSGNDRLNGGDGADELNGQGGNDVMTGGTGADRFVFGGEAGADRIRDFDVAEDLLDLSGLGTFASLADVQAAATDTAEGVVIALDGDSSVLLEGVQEADLTSAALVF